MTDGYHGQICGIAIEGHHQSRKLRSSSPKVNLQTCGRIASLRGRIRAPCTHACICTRTYVSTCTNYELYVARAYAYSRGSRAYPPDYMRAFTSSATRARLPGALEILSSLAHANRMGLCGEAAN